MALIWHGKDVDRKLLSEARKRVREVCLVIESTAKGLMKKGGRTESGELEKGKKPSRVGTFASAPGEPPRVQTGTLRRSITHEIHPTLPIGRVGTNLEYARALELGFLPRNLKPRPFMRPAMHLSEPLAKHIFGRKMRD